MKGNKSIGAGIQSVQSCIACIFLIFLANYSSLNLVPNLLGAVLCFKKTKNPTISFLTWSISWIVWKMILTATSHLSSLLEPCLAPPILEIMQLVITVIVLQMWTIFAVSLQSFSNRRRRMNVLAHVGLLVPIVALNAVHHSFLHAFIRSPSPPICSAMNENLLEQHRHKRSH